jgi:hypothetical protein
VEDEHESDELNKYSMCHLEGEDRSLAVFTIRLPTTGDYFFKCVSEDDLL